MEGERKTGKGFSPLIGVVLLGLVIATAVAAATRLSQKAEAKFEVVSLKVVPSQVIPGEAVTVEVEVRNTGRKAGTFDLSLLVDGAVRDTKRVSLLPGEGRTITFSLAEEEVGSHDIQVGGMHRELRIVGVPKFEFSDLIVSPPEVRPPEKVKISVRVTNVGKAGGSCPVRLKIDGLEEAEKDVYLGPGESQVISFEVGRREPKGYLVEIGSLTGSFTVRPVVELSVQGSFAREISSTLLYSLPQEKLNQLREPLITLRIFNRGTGTAKGVTAKARIVGYGDYFSCYLGDLRPGEWREVRITPKASSEIMNLTSDTYSSLHAVVGYYDEEGRPYTWESSEEVLIKARNFFCWDPPELVSAWVTPTHEAIRGFATEATRPIATYRSDSEVLQGAERIYNQLGAYGLRYVSDAHTTGDYVQFPVETLSVKSGDCDDFAVLYSSLLESIGIKTRLVLIPGHIFVGIVLPSGRFQPVEPTMIGFGSFQDALRYGESEYEDYKSRGEIEAEIDPSWEQAIGIKPANITMSVPLPSIDVIVSQPVEGYVLGIGYYQDVTVTFVNKGNATGMRGIRIWGCDQSWEPEYIVTVGGYTATIGPVTLGPRQTYSTTIRFDTEKGDVLTVYYEIIQ